ncbi:hypothetical protein IAQ61_006917 [Plenodomus lingam]|uniref:Predicted protein n=1 Tax=Leptosphaeria maculans (strain JN3 / isolate v23.1.3 / race Av1-4-5-6-7-8) TaxID=985895 RepID=E5ACY2_LEPMJ|nr:predicted protein [Plenodomus lingam JN3]KAH9869705.1 hypothetical protein IAQ61_006917 [Plenodomus lingam]CBY02334.1 predicted protein [Plenodomus lingam JN3]
MAGHAMLPLVWKGVAGAGGGGWRRVSVEGDDNTIEIEIVVEMDVDEVTIVREYDQVGTAQHSTAQHKRGAMGSGTWQVTSYHDESITRPSWSC